MIELIEAPKTAINRLCNQLKRNSKRREQKEFTHYSDVSFDYSPIAALITVRIEDAEIEIIRERS